MKQHSSSILSIPTLATQKRLRHPWLAALPAILVALPGLGCYRASGIQRPDVVAEEISQVGGDRVHGLKAQGAPGDFYLGNDYVEIAVDGTPFGERLGVAGAPGGGSIIDVGEVALDQNYKRVSMPTDTLDRLTAVLNQDPQITLVFDRFKPLNSDTEGRIEMEGYVHDPAHRLTGASWDTLGRVQGVSVTHVVSLLKANRYFLLQTTVANNSSSPLGIHNIGDLLAQGPSGGFRFNVPASEDMADQALSDWGMEIPSPSLGTSGVGTTFGDVAKAVKAPMVAFMGVEPVGTTEDVHSTLGLLPVDADRLVVTSDPQKVLDQVRPMFPQRLIAGGLPAGNLAAGASITHARRLYLTAGSTVSGAISNQASGLFNLMAHDRSILRPADQGALVFQPSGTAVRQGPYPSQFRIERNVGGAWKLERLEWMEPFENSPTATNYYLPQLSVLLPVGTYRLAVQNAFGSKLFTHLVNANTNTNTDRPDLPGPIVVALNSTTINNSFVSNSSLDYICPERDEVLGASGALLANKVAVHGFATRQLDGTVNSLQPARISVFGLPSTPDPSLKRTRILSSSYNAVYRMRIPVDSNYGVYGFLAGNQVFAASMPPRNAMSFWLAPGDYLAYAIRGPLSQLDSQPVKAFDGQTQTSHIFTAETAALPVGWTSFDLPGPSLATTGGMLPVEKLSSALAEGIQVVGMTEQDRLVDSAALAADFRNEFLMSTIVDADRTVIGSDPFIIEARSSDLGNYGFATALFTPAPRNERNGGARDPKTWTLADFLVQAEGQYNVIHRPRGPQGLFTLQAHLAFPADLALAAIDPASPLGVGANAWWNATSPLSSGRSQGSFDALELLRAEGCNPADPSAWFTEFKAVRSDWFTLLGKQTPTVFTKALGLSSAKYSLDTPVGLTRTYLKATGFTQGSMAPLLQALQQGAAVASTGPLLDATLTAAGGTTAFGPGGLVSGPTASVTLTVNLWAPSWVPVEELRVTIDGVTQVLDIAQLQPLATTAAGYDKRLRRGTFTLPLPVGKDAWVVVEAGVPLNTSGVYAPAAPLDAVAATWNKLMKGIYPIAVTNPIFVDTTGGGYTPPGL